MTVKRDHIKKYIGVSTDVKPTWDPMIAGTVMPGTEFYETDTYDTYVWDGSAWKLKTDVVTVTEITPLSEFVSGSLTLTLKDTAYLIPASEQAGRRSIAIYNGSDFNVYVGSSLVTTTNGILVSTGGTLTLDASANIYAVCATSEHVINYLEGK